MAVLRYALAILAVMAVLAIALLGGFYIMGPFLQGAGGSRVVLGGGGTQAAISTAQALPTRGPSSTPLSAEDLLPTRVPSNTPGTPESLLSTTAPTVTPLATEVPSPSALPPSALPPSALPPSALPPSALPPSAVPPSTPTVVQTDIAPSPEPSATAVAGEPAGIVVAPATLTVREPDGSGTFVITLSSEPEGTVSIPLSVEGDKCSVASAEVTLDSTNWSTGVSVVVAVADDAVVDGDQVCVVGTGAARSSGADYAEMSVEDVTVTVEDDDTAGIAVAPVSLTVSEPEGTETFVIALSSEPEGAVTIPLSVASDECSVTPGEVTLDSTNWRTGVSVAVEVVDDDVVDGDQVCVVGTGGVRSSGADYVGLTVEDVTVLVEDDDAAGIVVSPATLTVAEPEGSQTFVIALSSEPEGAVGIALAVAGNECSVTPGEVTLDTANWRAGVSVAVAAVDDEVVDGNQVCVVGTGAANSSGADYAGMAVEDVMVTVEDDDAAGIVVAPAVLTVREPEGSETFVVTLSSEPEAAVSFALSVASDECSVTPGEVTLNAANWRTGASVEVSAVDDEAKDGDQVCVVGIGAARSTGADYAGITVEDVAVTVVDDDMAGIVIMPAKLTVAEPEGSETFVIALSSEPEAAVSIPMSVASDECSVTPDSVTLDSANWRSGVQVAVAALDDAVEDGDQECVIGTGPVTSAGADYAGVTVKDVIVTVVDDDAAGIVIVPSQLSVREPDGSETFVIALSSEPEAAVRIALSVASDECTVTPEEVTLGRDNWQSGMSVVVAAVDDEEADGDQDCVVAVGPARSSGADYDGLTIEGVAVAVVDDDAAGIAVWPTSLVVSELDGSATYEIVLSSEPADAVVVSITAGEEAAVSPASLTFSGLDWNIPQSVVVTVVDDDIAEGQRSSTISHMAASSDENYDGAAIDDVTVKISDNEVAGVIVAPNEVAVGEGEAPQAYAVVLASQPSDAVEVSVSTDEQTDVDPALLTFPQSKWNVPQKVNVTAVDDDDAEGPHASIISHVASSDDENYDDVPIDDVTAQITDDEAGGATVVVTESVAEGSSPSEPSPFDAIRNIKISPVLALVIVLAVVASLVELRIAKSRKDKR